MLKWTLTGLSLVIFILFSLQITIAGEPQKANTTLIQLWETDNRLEVPESVLYVKSDNFFFVSNISGKPSEKNGKGFVSKFSMDGKILKLKWATGLNAPKGMAIHGDHLYVSDIDRLVQIALASGNIEAEFTAPGARFLNDVAADKAGDIYVSDTSKKNSVIYRLTDGKIRAWMSGADIKKPNGLYMQKKQLLVGNSGDGCIKSINLKTRKVEVVARAGCGIDGLHPVGKGAYLISDWKGKTAMVNAEGDIKVLMDTTDMKINSADFDYVDNKNILLIPTFFDNRVVAYKLK